MTNEASQGRVAHLQGSQPTHTFTVQTTDDMHAFGVRLGRALAVGDLVLLTGPLGAGKTTLTRGIGEGLGVRGPVQSPTFVIARTHPSLADGPQLVHIDAYRLSGPDELEDLDLDFDGSVVVAEWGGDLAGVRESWIELVIERPTGRADKLETGASMHASDDDAPEEPRMITVTGHGPRWRQGIPS